MSKITILIVDDHQLIRDSWASILTNDPRLSVVAVAASGEQAIELARETRPDIVLMDINMTGLSGFDATPMVKKFSPGSKVIGLSMHSMPAYAKKMIRMGGAGYITKNSDKNEFIKAILEVEQGKVYVCDEIKNILVWQEMEETNEHRNINILSRREIDVVKLIKEGLSSREIGLRLAISLKTVEVHRYNILRKLNLKNTASLVNFVNAQGV